MNIYIYSYIYNALYIHILKHHGISKLVIWRSQNETEWKNPMQEGPKILRDINIYIYIHFMAGQPTPM